MYCLFFVQADPDSCCHTVYIIGVIHYLSHANKAQILSFTTFPVTAADVATAYAHPVAAYTYPAVAYADDATAYAHREKQKN